VYRSALTISLLFASSLCASQFGISSERTRYPIHETSMFGEFGGGIPSRSVGKVSPDFIGTLQAEEAAEELWRQGANPAGYSWISTASTVLMAQPERVRNLGLETSGSTYSAMHLEAGFSPEFGLIAVLFGFCVGVALLGGTEKIREQMALRRGIPIEALR